MTTGSLRLGRIAGIPVRAHWSAALIVVLYGVFLTAQYGVVAGSIAALALFASILAHEFGHALVARRHGVNTESIDLWALGGMARLDRESPTPRADASIAVAGPLVSLALGIAGIGAFVATRIDVLGWIGAINLVLAVFNMLPGAPLDGGRVVRAWRWSRTGSRYRGMRDAAQAGRVLGWSLGIIGLALVLNGQAGFFLVVVGMFVAFNARAEMAVSYIGEQLDGIAVRDLTWFGVAHAGGDMDADSMLWQRQRLGNAGAVAVDADHNGELDGVVLEDQLWALPDHERALTMLTSMMVPFEQTARAAPDDDLTSVLGRLNPLRPIVTVWQDDRLAGIIPPNVLRERLEQAQAAAAAR
ncbi:MAG: site-2 protease family protein [Actinomycetota bacterium]